MIEVIQGEKQPFTIRLRSKSTGDPWDLSANVEIKVCFKSGTTIVEKLKTLAEVSIVGAVTEGKIQTDLLIADTNLLPKTTEGHIEVLVDYGSGDVRKTQILGAFHVIEKICS